jgi:ribonuclease HI
MNMDDTIKVYTDGGGFANHGTWSYVVVNNDGELVSSGYGVVACDELVVYRVQSNIAEIYAVIKAMEVVNDPHGIVYTDSTVCKSVFAGFEKKRDWIPDSIKDSIARTRKKILGKWKVKRVASHPTVQELEKGKRGRTAVSSWNVMADKLCQKAKQEFKSKLVLA